MEKTAAVKNQLVIDIIKFMTDPQNALLISNNNGNSIEIMHADNSNLYFKIRIDDKDNIMYRDIAKIMVNIYSKDFSITPKDINFEDLEEFILKVVNLADYKIEGCLMKFFKTKDTK